MEYPPVAPVHPARTRPTDAFDAVSWSQRREVEERMSSPARVEDQTLAQILTSLPDWAVITVGGVVAAVLGAMVGGALHI